jgi:hypothetical protein
MAMRLSALRAGRTLLPGRFLTLISVRGWVEPRSIVRLEGLGQLKNPMISGNEPATFRLVAQCFNQLRYRMSSEKLRCDYRLRVEMTWKESYLLRLRKTMKSIGNDQAGVMLTLQTWILEVLGSNFGWNTSNLEWRFQWLASVPSGKCRDSTAIRPRPLPYK